MPVDLVSRTAMQDRHEIGMQMKVVDHEPYAWFLLQEGDTLYLDAHCSHSFVDYSVLVALDDQERARFDTEGRDYLDRLSHDIHYSAPIVRESNSPWKTRNLTASLGDQVNQAVARWREERESG
jgi:hypothetical protein